MAFGTVCTPRISPFARKVANLLLVLLMCAWSVFCWAQAQDVNDSTATPVGGVGHDYIGMLNETVNPATGSLSLRIHVPVPPGRKLTMPFAFAYDSAAAWHFSVKAGQGPQYQPPLGYAVNSSNLGTLAYGGWSAAVPQLSALEYQWDPNHPVTDGSTTCNVMASFIFAAPDGSMHQLFLVHIINSHAQACQEVPAFETDTGGDGEYQAVITDSGLGDVRVASPDGTVYDFYFGGVGGGCGTNPGALCELPSWVEDRNGNIVSTTGGGPTFTDDTGRNSLALNNYLGPNGGRSSGSGSVTVSGLANSYTINWESLVATGFPISVTSVSSDPDCLVPPKTVGATDPISGGFGGHLVQSIVLPNNEKYQLSYDSVTGYVNKVTYPTGGYVSYTWGTNPQSSGIGYNDTQGGGAKCGYLYDTPAVTARTVSFDGSTIALKQTFSYQTTWYTDPAPGVGGYWTSKTTTVTTQDMLAGTTSKTVYTYGYQALSPPPAFNPGMQTGFIDQTSVENSVAYHGYSSQSYPLLKTETKSWNLNLGDGPTELVCDLVTLDNGYVSGALYKYGAGEQITDKKEYDFPQLSSGTTCQNINYTNPPAPTRETETTYQSFAATPIFPGGPSIFDRPSSVQVYAGATLMAETDYAYDGTAVGSVSSLTGHDATNYSTSYNNRGNATTKTAKCFVGSTACTNAVSTYTYDETGQALTMVDPNGNTTSYSYTDNYLSGSGTPPGTTNAYVTTITHPKVGSVTTHDYFQYAYSDGQLTESQDDNDKAAGVSTAYTYADSLRRLTETAYPDGGQVSLSYNDTPPSPSVTKTVLITASPSLSSVTTTTMDGMGHAVMTQLTSDPEGTDTTNTTYDGLGRVRTQSNPHRSASSPTDGTRTNSYDAIGRITSVLQSDGSTLSTSYSGNCTTVTDEIGKSRTSCTDGLGRLTQVFEAPATLNYETQYQYDVLNNLLCAVQQATDTSPFTTCAAAKATWRPRSFQYDSLSRLISATNPESGTISYSYDLNGNLLQKTSPEANQSSPATTTNINFCYDALNRETSKAYNTTACPPTSPTATYTYDQGTNGIGHRTGMTDGPGSASWTYDIMGRVVSETRVTSNVTKTTSYVYNKDGSVQSITYPSTRVVNYTYSGAGRTLSAIDPTGPINYVTSTTYAPPGELSTYTNGYVSGGFAGITTANTYSTRLQPVLLSAASPSASIFSLCYDFHLMVTVSSPPCPTFNASSVGDNGNVYQIVNNRGGTRTQNFTYDDLNRVQTAYTNGTNWGESFGSQTTPGGVPTTPGIDAWGNLWQRSAVTGKTNYEGLSCVPSNNNQLGSCQLGYDAAGNTTSNGSTTYTYDQENRLTSAGGTYIYDGDGRRVEKNVSGAVTLYWYGATGSVLDETDSTGTLVSEYVFFNGKRIARRDADNTVKYYFSDDLGSASVIAEVVDNVATIIAESDYYPYGGEIVITSGDSNHYKFTGKERDAESGLDNFGARYDSSSLGRFMTPDWAAKATAVPYATFGDPQTLNLYSYVENAPLNRIDADGHDVDGPNGPSTYVIHTSPCSNVAGSEAKCYGISVAEAASVDQSDANSQGKAKAQNRPKHHKHPKPKTKPLPSSGEASIYADKFEGRQTSNGETFHQSGNTAALLPKSRWHAVKLGTKVKLTSDGNSVVVEINDRGAGDRNPNSTRTLDLSRAAASTLTGQEINDDEDANRVGLIHLDTIQTVPADTPVGPPAPAQPPQ